MKIKITGRHIDVSERLKDYAEKKIARLEKHFQQLIDIHLILYVEKLDHVAELIVNGDSLQFHAREKAADLYSAIDLLVDKMESQIARFKEKIQSRKGFGVEYDMTFDFMSEKGTEAVLNQVSNKPIDKIEAFLQMKINNKDYILFKKGVTEAKADVDYWNKNYAVIYKSDGKFRMAEIPFENIRENEFSPENFVEYDLDIIDESPANPKISFNKNSICSIKNLTFDEAFESFEKSGSSYMPFFNSETRYFNIICRSGRKYEVLVPSY